MDSNVKFISAFSDLILDYLALRSEEIKYLSHDINALLFFDEFCFQNHIVDKPVFASEHAAKLELYKPIDMTQHAFYILMTKIKKFLKFVIMLGYSDIAMIGDINRGDSSFKPYIYSAEEKKKYVEAADSYRNSRNPHIGIYLPVMVRLLICTGMRVSEMLNINFNNVNLETGFIDLLETKNGSSRRIPIGRDLCDLLGIFINYYVKPRIRNSRDPLFIDNRGRRITTNQYYSIHRELLLIAGICFHGDGRGPRVHDWRHTFCVDAFHKMYNEGRSLENIIPYLSCYLGHKNIYATEKYLHMSLAMYPEIQRALNEIYDKGILSSSIEYIKR